MSEHDSNSKFTVNDRRSSVESSESAKAVPDGATTAPSAASPPHETGAAHALPEIDFSTFVMSLASSALIQLGELYDPTAGPESGMPADLPLAKQTVNIVGMLAEKTRGNLTAEEARLMEHLLYDLRLKYVAAKKKQ